MRRTFERVFGLLRRRELETPPPTDAGTAIQAHAEDHTALFERASRLREKADRLDREGTPSESARNRARRAEEEVETGLRELRALLAVDGGEQARKHFDREVARRYPRLQFSGE